MQSITNISELILFYFKFIFIRFKFVSLSLLKLRVLRPGHCLHQLLPERKLVSMKLIVHLITAGSYRFANMCVINVLLLYAVSLIMLENVHAVLA